MYEYQKVVDSKLWEPTDNKRVYKDEPLLCMASTMKIEDPVNKTAEKVYCKILHKGKENKYGVGSYNK